MPFDVQSAVIGAFVGPALWLTARALRASVQVRPDATRHTVPLRVVITGSSKGLGLALAEAFLELGDSVCIASRDATRTAEAAAQLQSKFPSQAIFSQVADVRQEAAMEALADYAVKSMGGVDIWVNNAGCSQSLKASIVETPVQVIQDVVDTNVLGSILGSRAAMRVMSTAGSGRIFLIDGAGATGGGTPGSAAYGASKRALTQLKASLVAEGKIGGVAVHLASPGMVATDLLAASASSNPHAARILNILAEEPRVVARWLAPRMRGVSGSGKYFKFLTPLGALWRFATAYSRRGRFYAVNAASAK